jgi:uncharacterized membrane protein YhiD involved in acid resistance
VSDAVKRERDSMRWTTRTWRGHAGTLAVGLLLAAFLGAPGVCAGSDQPKEPQLTGEQDQNPPTHRPEEASLKEAIVALPIAAALGAVLAFRPQRRGTPPRQPAVIQTQIILAVVGALVMLVVGASIARAFGIVGAAGLVRYRSKIEDPKDAVVMLACLAMGLASGVGIYLVALVSTVFVLALVWVLESKEPEVQKDFLLAVKGKGSGELQSEIEKLLRRNGIKYELRTAAQDELTYSLRLPLSKRTDRLTSAILALGDKDEMTVDWSEKKPSKAAA